MSDPIDAQTDAQLSRALARLRAEEPAPTEAFMARITADALAAMPPARHEAGRAPRPAPWLRLRAGLATVMAEVTGGWRGGIALTASAALGLAIGYSDPAAIQSLYETAYETALDQSDPVTGDVTDFIALALQDG